MVNSSKINNFLTNVCIYDQILDPDNSTTEINTGVAAQEIFAVFRPPLFLSVTWFIW